MLTEEPEMVQPDVFCEQNATVALMEGTGSLYTALPYRSSS